MSAEVSREALLSVVRRVWEERDPVPEGLVAKMQAVVASEGIDFEYELLVLTAREFEGAGTRGSGPAYTLQFAHGDVALLVRAAAGEPALGTGRSSGRLDGWLAPATAMTVRATRLESGKVDKHVEEWETEVDDRGRFEFRDLPGGLFRLWLMPRDAAEARPFGTPAFEL